MAEELVLQTHFEDRLVGAIRYRPAEDDYAFEYETTWTTDGKFRISPHIPYEGARRGVLKRYLENLLPEGKALQDLSRLMAIPKSNVFALINALGRDLSGALRLTAGGSTGDTRLRPITDSELKKRLENRARQPIAIWDGKPRLSLAGVQDKLPVLRTSDGGYAFAEGQLASTHILKFAREDHASIVLNEYFCMRLARAAGLDVADVRLRDLGEKVLEVTRFDRRVKGPESVARLHVIDGCQALDISPDQKYERFLGDEESVKNVLGPANLANLYAFGDQCREPAKTKLKILHWVLFNLLIGNSDNHLKNISFFVDDSGIRLAPFYDFVCVTVYESFNPSLAFAIGETFEPRAVDARELLLMAHELNLTASFVKRQMQSLIKSTKAALGRVDLSDMTGTKDELAFVRSLKALVAENLERFHNITQHLAAPK